MSEECECGCGEIDNFSDSSPMVEDFLIRTRRLLLTGNITETLSTYICSNLQMLSLSPDPIYMYINSLGGCLSSGYAIIDQMCMCRCPVYTIVRGDACSMAAMIVAFGKKGHRYAMPNSSFMLHSAIIQGGSGSIEQVSTMVSHLGRDYCTKTSDLAKRLKIDAKKIRELMKETVWMTPKEAMKIGLIDGVWTSSMERKIG